MSASIMQPPLEDTLKSYDEFVEQVINMLTNAKAEAESSAHFADENESLKKEIDRLNDIIATKSITIEKLNIKVASQEHQRSDNIKNVIDSNETEKRYLSVSYELDNVRSSLRALERELQLQRTENERMLQQRHQMERDHKMKENRFQNEVDKLKEQLKKSR